MDAETLLAFTPIQSPLRSTIVTIGNFDGVHIGHQAILRQMVECARLEQLETVVITFRPHPRTYFAKKLGKNRPSQIVPIISSFPDKYQIIREMGIDRLFVLEFDDYLSAVTAEDFVQKLLVEQLHVRHLWVGADFQFGRQRQGNLSFLQHASQSLGFSVHPMEAVHLPETEQKVSSSTIREALHTHQLALAAQLLGRPYQLSAKVIHGAKLGRTLGFPTLNLLPPQPYALPNGIYWVRVHGITHNPQPGVASLGVRPTLGDNLRQLLEVYLLDYSADLYGQRIRIEFIAFSRSEQSFASLADLQTAIQQDVQQARSYFHLPPLK